MMGKADIDTLTIEQYQMFTQGNQAQGMVKTKFRGMMKKDIEDMTIAEYMEYEAEMKRQIWRNARSYFPTKYENKDINSLNHDKNRYEPLEEDIDYVSEEESETSDQRMSNDTVDDKPFTPKPQPEGEVSFVADNEEGDIFRSLYRASYHQRIEPKEFTLSLPPLVQLYLYVMADLGASVNVMQKNVFEHLKLANLKETDMVVEMAYMMKKAPLGITQSYDKGNVDTLDSANNMQELEDKHKDMVRYGNKDIDDTTREKRYYEWVAQYSEFKDNDSSYEATMCDNPCKYHHEYPRLYFPQKNLEMPKLWESSFIEGYTNNMTPIVGTSQNLTLKGFS
ncbi:hypothetical protein Tco_1386454 [Tanacetum coccineum]